MFLNHCLSFKSIIRIFFKFILVIFIIINIFVVKFDIEGRHVVSVLIITTSRFIEFISVEVKSKWIIKAAILKNEELVLVIFSIFLFNLWLRNWNLVAFTITRQTLWYLQWLYGWQDVDSLFIVSPTLAIKAIFIEVVALCIIEVSVLKNIKSIFVVFPLQHFNFVAGELTFRCPFYH